jgi:hypothetical protein
MGSNVRYEPGRNCCPPGGADFKHSGVVLSIVAVVFAIRVNNRATDVNNQMIRSLQKIESSVERMHLLRQAGLTWWTQHTSTTES